MRGRRSLANTSRTRFDGQMSPPGAPPDRRFHDERLRARALVLVLAVLASAITILSVPTPADASSSCLRTLVIGHSRQGRAIIACERGDVTVHPLLVIGQMHGNERAGVSVAYDLMRTTLPEHVHLWIIPTMNPDGYAHNNRYNAARVDLNRNFPIHWVHTNGAYPTGPRPASEPETRAVMAFTRTYQPHTTIVIHQPLNVVDFGSYADPAVTYFVARRMHMRAEALNSPIYHGNYTSWSNAHVSLATAFTFEFAAKASSAQRAQLASTIVQLASWRNASYATRITSSARVDALIPDSLVSIRGRVQWRNYAGTWVDLQDRRLVVMSAPTAQGPFVAVQTVNTATTTGAFVAQVHLHAPQCLRIDYAGTRDLGAAHGPVVCITLRRAPV
jgi:protein MpaA